MLKYSWVLIHAWCKNIWKWFKICINFYRFIWNPTSQWNQKLHRNWISLANFQQVRRRRNERTNGLWRQSVSRYYLSIYLFKFNSKNSLSVSPEKSILTCGACRIYVASLLSDFRAGAPPEQLADSAFGMCRLITPFTEAVCRGVIDLNLESML